MKLVALITSRCRTCPWMNKGIDFIISGLVQYSQLPSWLRLFYMIYGPHPRRHMVYSNFGRGVHTWMMYTTMVPQTGSDYTFWRERAEVHININFLATLRMDPLWAPGFGVLSYWKSSPKLSGRLTLMSLSCQLMRATRTHIVQQL